MALLHNEPYAPVLDDEFFSQAAGAAPGAGSVLLRFVGWVALGLWLGGEAVLAFVARSAPEFALHWVQGDARHTPDEMRARVAIWMYDSFTYQIDEIALACALVLLVTSLVAVRWAARRSRLVAWSPFALTVIGILLLIRSAGTLFGNFYRAGQALADGADRLRDLALAQLAVTLLMALCLAVIQTPRGATAPLARD